MSQLLEKLGSLFVVLAIVIIVTACTQTAPPPTQTQLHNVKSFARLKCRSNTFISLPVTQSQRRYVIFCVTPNRPQFIPTQTASYVYDVRP